MNTTKVSYTHDLTWPEIEIWTRQGKIIALEIIPVFPSTLLDWFWWKPIYNRTVCPLMTWQQKPGHGHTSRKIHFVAPPKIGRDLQFHTSEMLENNAQIILSDFYLILHGWKIKGIWVGGSPADWILFSGLWKAELNKEKGMTPYPWPRSLKQPSLLSPSIALMLQMGKLRPQSKPLGLRATKVVGRCCVWIQTLN